MPKGKGREFIKALLEENSGKKKKVQAVLQWLSWLK